MPVNLSAPDPASLLPVAGVTLGTARAGIRKPGRRDLLVVCFSEKATACSGLHPQPLLRGAGHRCARASGDDGRPGSARWS